MEKDVIGLNLGCGPNILEGWRNTDIEPIDKRVEYLDASKPFPIEDESLAFIFSEHMFEHLSYQDGKNMLRECYRVLKPNGVLRLSLPTLDFLVNLFINRREKKENEYIEWSIKSFDESGCKDDIIDSKACFVINNFYRLWGHKMLYDIDTIFEMLHNAGFKGVRCALNDDSIIEELRNVNCHARHIGKLFNDLETTTFEAQKIINN